MGTATLKSYHQRGAAIPEGTVRQSVDLIPLHRSAWTEAPNEPAA